MIELIRLYIVREFYIAQIVLIDIRTKSGVDALIVISDLENEIRSKLRYDAGEFKEFYVDVYNEDGTIKKKKVNGCDDTLERVGEVLRRFMQERNLPELT